MKRKNLKRALALGLVLASTSLLGMDTDIFRSTAYAASTYGTVDVDGYDYTNDIAKTATANSGVMYDGGWYAPDGKFYTYVDSEGNVGSTLIQCDVVSGKAVLTTAQENTLVSMGLDHNEQADSVADNKRVPSYLDIMDGSKFTAENVAQALEDNLKFNSDLVRTVCQWEEADRKATDKFLNTKIETIKATKKDTNTYTLVNGDGTTTTISFTDTNTDTNTTVSGVTTSINNSGVITTTVKSSDGTTKSDTVNISNFVNTSITNNAGDATVTIGGTSTTIEQAINNNYNSISTNTTEITNIKNNYVTNITEGGIDENGDIINRNEHFWTVNQIIDGVETPVTVKDLNTTNDKLENVWGNSDDITITLTDTDGKFVQTTLSNIAKASDVDNLTDVIGAGTTQEIINKYGDTNYITNETTLIDADIKLDQEIKNINNNNVTNITKNDNNSWTVTQTVNGESTPVTITDTVTTASLGKSANLTLNEEINKTNNTIHYTIDLKDDVTFNSVTSNTVNSTTVNSTTVNTETINVGDNITIQEGNVDMGGNKITNVYEGDLYQGSMDAVNGGQLWQTNQRLDSLGNRVDKVGAGAAALAALHPLDFDPDDKLSFSAGVGNYAGSTASAIGAFYRPDERTMFSIGGTVGNGENMVNAGVSFALGRGGHVTKSRVAMAHEINDLRAQVAELTAMVSQLAAIHSNFKFDSMRPFPDTPENHWAYEYIGKLAAEGIVEGYPDGNFSGERSMTRYEFGAMLYRALQKGFAIDERLIDEFEPELGRLSVERIKGELNQKNKIERVRINDKGEDRDVYGGKITVGKTW